MRIQIIIFLLLATRLHAQLPETDIYISNIKSDSTGFTFSKPENITNRQGYENQPYFTPDGNKLLYVVADSSQSDVYSYDIQAKISMQLTETRESEYSPAFTPNKRFLSVVRVDADSGQRFYCYPLSNLRSPVYVNNSDSIGYACWLNDSLLAMFILGKSNTLQILNTKTHERKLIASDIGRCMKLSPDMRSMYFVLKGNPAEWFIYSMSIKDFSLKRIRATLPKSEDFAFLPNGDLIMGSEGKLYLTDGRTEWRPIADFTAELHDFYRLAVSPDGSMLALVAFTGKKP